MATVAAQALEKYTAPVTIPEWNTGALPDLSR